MFKVVKFYDTEYTPYTQKEHHYAEFLNDPTF